MIKKKQKNSARVELVSLFRFVQETHASDVYTIETIAAVRILGNFAEFEPRESEFVRTDL